MAPAFGVLHHGLWRFGHRRHEDPGPTGYLLLRGRLLAYALEVDEFSHTLVPRFEQESQGSVIGSEQSHLKSLDVRGVR